MNDTARPPAPLDAGRELALGFGTRMSPALRIMLDDRLFERAKAIAHYMAKGDGVVPRHLLNKPEACFAVVTRAMTWGLDPYAVAASTYQTPGGNVGFEGKLVQAIIENSGSLDGPVRFFHFGTLTYKTKEGATIKVRTIDTDQVEELRQNGATLQARKDWDAVIGKFEIKTGKSGNPYPAPTWNRSDAEGLGVEVRAQVHNETDLRTWPFLLIQAFPLNSTLWATDPKSQICYTAVRRFANLAAPGLLMGVPFEREDLVSSMVDVTPPRPQRGNFQAGAPAPREETMAEQPGARDAPEDDRQGWEILGVDGVVTRTEDPEEAVSAMLAAISEAAARGEDHLDGIWKDNAMLISSLREANLSGSADALVRAYDASLAEIHKARRAAAEVPSGSNAAQGAPSQQQTVAAEDKTPAAQAASGEPAAAPTPAKRRPSAPSKSPLSTKRHTDWPAWIETFLRYVGSLEAAEVDQVYNTYLAEIDFCRDNRAPDYDRIVAAFDAKRG